MKTLIYWKNGCTLDASHFTSKATVQSRFSVLAEYRSLPCKTAATVSPGECHNNQLLSSIYAYTHALLTDTYIHTNIHIHTSIRTYIHTYIQGKAIPVEAWRCSWVSRNLSLPEFLDNGQKKVARLWAVRKAASNSSPTPQEIPLKLISVGVWVDYRIGGTKWKKNRTLDLMVWSTVPQPTSSPRGTHNLQYIYRYLCIHGHIGLYIGAHTQIFDMW